MGSRKGMSTGLKVAVVAIIVLIIAVVILGIFTGGVRPVGDAINSWFAWMEGKDPLSNIGNGEGGQVTGSDKPGRPGVGEVLIDVV